jgi:acyl-CoA thioester hydrolase
MDPAPVETRFRVRFAETDQMGVVYHGHYIVWMEVGRVELCRARGVRYRDMEEQDGVMLAVAAVECRFRAPARYDDLVAVRTRIIEAHARMVTFGYEIVNAETGQLLVTGRTRHVFVNRQFKPAKLPAKYFALFGLA